MRTPHPKKLLQGVIFCLVLIIVYQVLDLNERPCTNTDSRRTHYEHDGLPWEKASNQKRSEQTGEVDARQGNVTLNKMAEYGMVHHHRLDKKKTTFVRNKARRRNKPKCYKQVQIWSREYTLWKQGEFACPGLPCGIRQYTSTSFKTMQASNAVVMWHETHWDWEEMHRNRPEGQRWILTTQESPINTRGSIVPPPKYYNTSYDYIMTYHEESDFYGSFGRYDATKATLLPNDTRNWADGKTQVVAWVARNCNNSYVRWKRTEFVHALTEMVNVDMYGKCGDKSCPRNEQICDKTLRKHKFYLSLENCNCRNYITEKFWKMAFAYDMVPVVFGPPREDYEAVAPPKSFIHVEDFNSIKELADYLDLLDMNDDRYNEYFMWKKQGSVHVTSADWLYQPEQMCQVVERLLEDERAKAEKTYTPPVSPDWDKWWWGSCKPIRDFPILMN